MAKRDQEITDKAREIFKLASKSATPITVVCTQAVKLFDIEHWELQDIEQVSGDAIDLQRLEKPITRISCGVRVDCRQPGLPHSEWTAFFRFLSE